MINFRYHVVSLTAVFLALAIGLVVGTAALNGPMADSLKDSVNAVGKDNQNLREQIDQLNDEVNREEDFVGEVAPWTLGGTLAGRRVLVLSLPDGREYVEGVVKMLNVANAKITARIGIEDKFTNPEKGVELLDLADRASVSSVPLATLPGNSDGVEKSSALLAAVLLDRLPAVTDADLRSVLSAYMAANYLTVEDKVSGPAEVVVVVAGLPYTDHKATEKNKAVVTMATEFDKAGKIVVAGSAVAGDGNVVSAVRGDPTLSKTISTVDNVNTSQGQFVTALAVREQLTSGVGQYGVGGGNEALMPKPAK